MLVRFATVVFITRNGWKLFRLVTSTWWKIKYNQPANSIQLMKEACWEGCCYVLRYPQFFASFIIRPAFHNTDFQNCRSWQVIRCIKNLKTKCWYFSFAADTLSFTLLQYYIPSLSLSVSAPSVCFTSVFERSSWYVIWLHYSSVFLSCWLTRIIALLYA